MKTLQQILIELLGRLKHDNVGRLDKFSNALYAIYSNEMSNDVIRFALDEQSTDNVLTDIEKQLKSTCLAFPKLSQSVSYLFNELTCNIQQHAHTNYGLIYAKFNSLDQTIDIALADHGISIYGSYAQAKKYIDIIGHSDAEAVGLAKDGYSTKDLPNAENRGYGLSSNIKMVTKGLKGEFAIYSGNALFLQNENDCKLLDLPNDLDIDGTMIVVRIPTNNIPNDYNFYEYIS